MIAFWLPAGLTYVAVTLLASGAGHLARPGAFRDVVRRQGIVPARQAGPVAAATVIAELVFGTAALVLTQRYGTGAAAVVFAGTLVMGLGFLAYVRRLLRTPVDDVGCGCSPLAGPLTPAARVPAAGLTIMSALSLTAVAASAAVAWDGGAAEPLAWLWGATLAVVVLLVPAVAPRPVAEGSS